MIDLPPAVPVALCPPPDGPPSTLLLASDPQVAAHARAFAREFLGYNSPQAPAPHLDDVVLVTSELVTNAYRYGTEPGDQIQVVLHSDDRRTRVEVHDPVRRYPSHRPVSDESTRGRGLFILDALCMGMWGCEDRPFGKFVWAEILRIDRPS
ncbi:ATP-binding protein [Streptomyces sp. NPDC046203]|uniref:ATP-binding protein n=1 Tax=Streptomyces sp. NPDC046203 TaxID=3154602 RepID=UPI0033C20D18